MRSMIAAISALWAGPAFAFCGTYVGSPGVELTNQTSQVVIAREGHRTTLTLANDYVGDARNFAMLIPVPEVLAEEDITTVRPELFQRFSNYSSPRVVTYECEDWETDYDQLEEGDGDADADSDADADADPVVVVEAEYSVGIYEIVILSSTESSALIGWLHDNGYGAEPNTEAMLGEYIEAGSFFFAAKVNLDSVAETEGSFLEPLQFGYDSAVFSLPIRLGTVNSPGEQDVVMYILTDEDDGQVGIANYPEVEIEDECMVDIYAEGGIDTYYGNQFADAWRETDGAAWMVEYAWATSWCDPCAADPPNNDELNEAGFSGSAGDTFFTRIRMRYTPEAATQDVTLYTSGIAETQQIRYIIYDELMEDRFPVCGIGMVDDPGSCDDVSGDSDSDADSDTDADADADADTDTDTEGGVDGYYRQLGSSTGSSSGCSTATSPGVPAAWIFLMGLLGLRRRDSSAG